MCARGTAPGLRPADDRVDATRARGAGERVFTRAPTGPTLSVLKSYRALEQESARLFEIVPRSLGVRVAYVHGEGEPYAGGSELCADLRERGTMTLATIARDAPHPLLGGVEGGVVDQLRVVHDVFGHAALLALA